MTRILSHLGLIGVVLLITAPTSADDGVLIFGANRNSGLEITKILVARGEPVTAFVRPTSNLENLEPLDVEYFKGDALNAEDVHQASAAKDFKAIISTLGASRVNHEAHGLTRHPILRTGSS